MPSLKCKQIIVQPATVRVETSRFLSLLSRAVLVGLYFSGPDQSLANAEIIPKGAK